MRISPHCVLALALLLGPGSAEAIADGGQIRLMQRRGNYQVTAFTSPVPMRVGPADISVLIQEAASGKVVANATIVVELSQRSRPHSPIKTVATAGAATNKLLYAAPVDIPAPGVWDVKMETTVAVNQALGEAAFTMEVAPPPPQWFSDWPWFTWPVIAMLLFAIHRNLVAHHQARQNSSARQ